MKALSMNDPMAKTYKTAAVFCLAASAYFFAPASLPEPARRVFFVFVWAALMWALEVIPLYATSLAVVILLTFLLSLPGTGALPASRGIGEFYGLFADPVIMLFLGGFVLAAALHKFHIDQFLVQKIVRFFGRQAYAFLLGFIATSAFISMWMSNTATTALMLALLKPVLEKLRSTDRFATALVLGVAFGANIGGIGTPVGTPPNAIVLGLLAKQGIGISFASWMLMAVPLVVTLLLILSVVLYKMFPPQQKQVTIDLGHAMVLDGRTKAVMSIAVVTVILWLSTPLHNIPESLVALLSVGAIISFGFLDRKDFNNIEWDILVLMWGGLALGKAMEITGLAKWVVGLPFFEVQGFALVGLFVAITFVVSTVMSNTAATSILVPLALSVSSENPVYLALVVTLTCGFDMALPVSSPPNALAFSTGRVKSMDMIKAGFLISIIAVVLIMAGYRYIFPITIGQ